MTHPEKGGTELWTVLAGWATAGPELESALSNRVHDMVSAAVGDGGG